MAIGDVYKRQGLLFAGVMYQQEADAAIIGKAFQFPHHFVILSLIHI